MTSVYTKRTEILLRPDMDRAIEILAHRLGTNASNLVRMTMTERLDRELPGWRDPAIDRVAIKAQEAERLAVTAARTCGCGARGQHRLSCPDRP